MINPSTFGWIDKFFNDQQYQSIGFEKDDYTFYKKIRLTGLIYGYPISFGTIDFYDTSKWTILEFTKVALLSSLYDIFEYQSHQKKYEDFIEKAVEFYKILNIDKLNLLQKVLPESNKSYELEDILDERVLINSNLLTRNFSYIITNALIFEDILAFQQFLISGSIPSNYLKNIEDAIVKMVSISLNIKTIKTEYEEMIIKLFDSSLRYSKFYPVKNEKIEDLDFKDFTNLEKYYIFDLSVMTIWSDEGYDENDKFFLYEIAKKIGVEQKFAEESFEATNLFFSSYKNEIPYFNFSSPIKNFYDKTTQMVKILIERNKNRLVKELINNKELLILLKDSANRKLDDKEKKKIRKQVIEICKTIPSLAVFLMPGGTLLLPILIKFIPKLLPSTFNENLEK